MDDAASATVAALNHAPPGIYNIVDNEPAAISTWLPYLAQAVRAKRPYAIPNWLGRILAGDFQTLQMTQARGLSNEKAKRLLEWRLRYPSWRTGFSEIQSSRA